MNGTFDVRTTPSFDRLLKKLASQHPQEASKTFAQTLAILKTDPYNRTRRHPIKKPEGVPPGEGQYRLRLRRWRFRYDIRGDRQQVELNFRGLRREDTYRHGYQERPAPHRPQNAVVLRSSEHAP
jgi:mRNA-degrading endonuclease RelE of RelBE toxin-antitoxin system